MLAEVDYETRTICLIIRGKQLDQLASHTRDEEEKVGIWGAWGRRTP